jgi:Flp pilus assembly protein TadG
MIESRARKREFRKGAAVVEAALVLPLFFLLLLGIFEIGWLMFVNNTLHYAVHQAARRAMVTPDGNDDGDSPGEEGATVAVQEIDDNLSWLNLPQAAITRTCTFDVNTGAYTIAARIQYSAISPFGMRFLPGNPTLYSGARVYSEHVEERN